MCGVVRSIDQAEPPSWLSGSDVIRTMTGGHLTVYGHSIEGEPMVTIEHGEGIQDLRDLSICSALRLIQSLQNSVDYAIASISLPGSSSPPGLKPVSVA